MPRQARQLTADQIAERNRLVEEFLFLVPWVAAQIKRPSRLGWCFEDSLQEGYVALIKMATEWILNPGDCSFVTTAMKNIRWRIKSRAAQLRCVLKIDPEVGFQVSRLHHGRALSRPRHLVEAAEQALKVRRLPVHVTREKARIYDVPGDPEAPGAFEDVHLAVRRLPGTERDLVDDLYGLSRPQLRWRDAAAKRGVSLTRIKQRRRVIIDKLRRFLASRPDREFFPRGKPPVRRYRRRRLSAAPKPSTQAAPP
jgi:hypothetical protein